MSVELLRFLALTFGPSITAAARPAVTFFAIQLTVAALAFYELVSVPDGFSWLVGLPALIVAGVLAALETAAKHDPDIAAVLRDLHIDTVTGAFGAFSVALLFASLGLPEDEAGGLVNSAAASSSGTGATLLSATAEAAASEKSTGVQVAAVGGAVGANVGLTLMRARLLEFVDDFDLGKIWARLETGGVVGVLIVLPLLPLFALGFLVLASLVLVVMALVARATSSYLDARRRVACEGCDYRVREEASVCPECGAEREPTVKHETGLGAAFRAIREREPEPELGAP